MSNYLIRRLLVAIPLLLAITIMTFTFINLAPGDPVDALIDPEFFVAGAGDALRARMGLDKPVHVRYLIWLREMLTGNFGYSYQFGIPVLSMIKDRMIPTLELTVVSLVAATVFGTALGVVQALRQYSIFDYSLSVGALFGISIPAFFFALLVLYVFVAVLGWFPSYGMQNYAERFDSWWPKFIDHVHHLILPASVVAVESLAGNMRYARTAMLEVMRSDYVRTAQAKGLSQWIVITRHAFRNALLPLVTVTTLRLPSLIGGIIIIEQMFAWPGMGQLSITAVGNRDYTVLMGLAFFTAVLVLGANLLADLLYAVADPRIRVDEQG